MAYNRKKELEETKRRMEREKLSGKAPVQKTVLNNDKATVQSYIEDRPKRLSAKIGSPRLDDAQITYKNKKFNKRKKTKDGGNFEWDGDMLKGLSSKTYGKSYAAKFESLANEAGIPKSQRGAFKDFLDAKEYGANPNENLDRATTDNDSRVSSLMKKNTQEQKDIAFKNSPEGKAKAKKDSRGVVDKSLDFLASLTAFDDKGYQKSKAQDTKPMSGAERFATRTVNSANLGIPKQLEKRVTGETPEYANTRKFGEGGGTDIMSDLLGYLAPGVGVAKALRGTKLGADVSKGALTKAGALTRAKEGMAVGGIMSGVEVGARETLNPEDYNWKQNAGQVALETGAGAVLDPLVSMLGPLAKIGADRSINKAVNTSNEDLVSRMMQGVGDVPRMPSPLDDMTPQNQLDRLMGQAQRQNVQAPRLDVPDRTQGDQALADYTKQYEDAQALASQTRQSNQNPLGLTDYEPNFTMRDSNPLLLNAPNEANIPRVPKPDAPLEEKIAYWKDPEMARTDSDVREIITTMDDIESNIRQFQDNLPQLRDVEMSKFPEETSIYRNARSLLKEYNEAEDLWRNAKEIQENFKDPKKRPEWAKFSLDSKMKTSEESGLIPARFIAKGTEANHGTDFAKAMDLAGFENEVDFINHLRYIDEQLKIGTRKDLSKLDPKTYKETESAVMDFENYFENNLKDQYGISDMEGQLEELSSLTSPYEPPTVEMNPLEFKTTQRVETPRDPITEILYPNNQYGVERGTSEAAVTTNEAPIGPESLAIEQAPRVAEIEPKMVRVKQQENLQAQATEIVTTQPEVLKTIISKGTKDSDQTAKRIIDTATKNPAMKVFRKFRQSMIGSKNSATYAETQLLKSEIPKVKDRLASATTDAEKSSLQYELDELNLRLKATKDTSFTQMALENELGSDIKANAIASDFVSKLNAIEGATLTDMANWQLAKRIVWLQGSENAGRDIPDSWGRFAQQTLEDGQGNPAFEQSEAVFRELQETRLQNVSQQKSQAEIEALLNEPYYVPLYLDKSYKVSKGAETGKGMKGIFSGPRSSSSEIDTIKSFANEESAGSNYEFIQNPLESIIDDLFREQRSIARNDTAQQFRRLSQMDDLGKEINGKKTGLYVTEVDEKTFNLNNGEANMEYLKGYENGEPFYLQIHPEFRKMLAENDAIDPVNGIQLATTLMSRLKTTSLEYMATAIPRDILTGFMNSEIRNPLRYGKELWNALTDESMKETGTRAGVQYRNAYDPQSASQQGAGALQEEIRRTLGTVYDETNIEKAKSALGKAWNVATHYQRKIAQTSDDLPRIVEANVVKNRWEKNVLAKTREEIAKVETELQNAPQGDFEAGPQLQAQLEQLQSRLAMETRSMEREMTHRGRDVMPYQRSGDSFLAKDIFKRYLNFANTTTQSKDKVARSFSRDPLGTAMKGAMLSAPIGIAIHTMYDNLSPEEQEKYDAIPDYMKQQRYIIPLPGERYISLPKVQELAILTNLADAEAGLISYEGALSYTVKETTPLQLGGLTGAMVKGGEEPRTATEFLGDVTVPSNLLSPAIDTIANRKMSFNNKPVSYNREGEVDEWTKDIYASLFGGSDAANFAQYGVQQYGGDLGKYGSALADMLYQPSSQDTGSSVRDINPFQDMFFTPNMQGPEYAFKKMFYDTEKLPK